MSSEVETKRLLFTIWTRSASMKVKGSLEVDARLGLHRLDLTEADDDRLLARALTSQDRRVEQRHEHHGEHHEEKWEVYSTSWINLPAAPVYRFR